MGPAKHETPSPLVLCLVADEEAAERCTTALRYLQVGLLDEAVAAVLVLPDSCRAEPLVSGPTQLVQYRRAGRLLGHWARRRLLVELQRAVGRLHRDAHVIVHSLSPATASPAAFLAESIEGDLIVGLWAGAEIERAGRMQSLDQIAVLFAPSARLHQALAASPLAARPIEMVPLGAPAFDSPAAFKAPQLSPTLVFVGCLSPDAGVDLMLRAIKRVSRAHPELLAFIIGRGPAENALRRLAESLDLQASVTFVGRLEHWRTVMAAGDVFCVPAAGTPYREEPLHALGAGLAIVAADGSPYDEFIDERTALLFADGDEQHLADRINRLLDDHDLARTLAAAGLAHARSQCSITRMVAEHVRVYRRLGARHQTLTLPTAR